MDQDSDEAIKPEDEDAGDAMENVKQLCHGILHLSRAVDPKFLQHPLGKDKHWCPVLLLLTYLLPSQQLLSSYAVLSPSITSIQGVLYWSVSFFLSQSLFLFFFLYLFYWSVSGVCVCFLPQYN